MRLRPATDADRDAVLALAVGEEAAWFGEPDFAPGELGEWVDEEGGVARGVVAEDDAGRIRGFASPGRREALFMIDVDLTDELAEALLPWLNGKRDDLQLMTWAGDAARLAAFERHGLRHERSSFALARPEDAGPVPAAVFPDGTDVAPYRLGSDDEAVHRLIYVDAAWASVPGHADRDLDGWRTMVRPCTALFLARRDDRPAGWVAGRLLESGRGWIDTLAVARTERGRGLGRALLLHAFTELQRAGARGLGLGVEAHNAAALGLYRSVGLEVEREWRTYVTAATSAPRA